MISIKDSIGVDAPAEMVFSWLMNIRTAKDYQTWHPDHVDCQWTKGEPFQEGSVALFVEYLHGKPHKLRFRCTRVIPNTLIEYEPSFPMSILMSRSQFVIEPKCEGSCRFTAVINFREAPFFERLFDKQMESLKQHMKEEGENLKRIIEGAVCRSQTGLDSNRSNHRK